MIFAINRGKVVQISVGALVCCTSFISGLFNGWTSPMTTFFTSPETKLKSGPMTTEEISFMTSLLYIGAIVGALLSGWLVNKIGRKWTLLIFLFPPIATCTLILVAESPFLLFLARGISGLVTGVSLVVPSIFAAEIVEGNLKTTIGTFSGTFYTIGIFFAKLLTGLYGIYAVPIATLPITIFFISCLVMCPDTPEYFLLCKRFDEAERSLKFYRGLLQQDKPLPEPFAGEFEEMKKQINLRDEKSSSVTIEDFLGDPTTILAIFVSFILISCPNFAGIRLTTAFTELLIKDSGIEVDLSAVDTSIASLQIIGCLISIYISRHNGVRRLFLIYFTIACLAFLSTGIHYYLHHSYNVDLTPITWSFIVFLTISVVIPSTGFYNLCLSVPPLILPVKIRGTILGVFSVFSLICATFIMHYYLFLVETIGNSAIFAVFSAWCLLGVIFTYFCIPEVNNMTYMDIVEALNYKLPKRFRN